MTNPLIFSDSAPAYFRGETNLTDWYSIMDWDPEYSELARHSYDIATYDDNSGVWNSILSNYGQEILVARYQSPGYFNDPGFLIVDHPSLTMHKKKSHFALWASFSAPLSISAYIPGLSAEEVAYLTKEDILAVDQDTLGLQVTLVSQDGTWGVLSKSLSNGDRLLTMLNRGSSTASCKVPFIRLGMTGPKALAYTVKNLWSGASSLVYGEIDAVNVPSHGTAIYRISSSEGTFGHVTPTGMVFNIATLNCPTAGVAGDVTWAACEGQDGQVWQVEKDDSLSPLSHPIERLSSRGNGTVALSPSHPGSKGQQWTYAITGNVQNSESSYCLTDDGTGSVTATPCENESDSQVFESPSGSLRKSWP
ncbi:MAG: hypothetical protein M1818_005524 [Claussenomyces sp. TS43310]|nr:MAG: hypothetical protein M1818_005524 [Claussenomyces sp. TS43310]